MIIEDEMEKCWYLYAKKMNNIFFLYYHNMQHNALSKDLGLFNFYKLFIRIL